MARRLDGSSGRIPGNAPVIVALVVAFATVLSALPRVAEAVENEQRAAAPSPATPPKSEPILRPAAPRDLVKPAPDRSVDQLLRHGKNTIALSTLVDELIDDVVHDLGRLDAEQISPLAIRAVDVSPNLKAAFARSLEAKLTAAVAQSTELSQVHCAACRAMRSRVEGDAWVITLGPVDQDDLRRLGESLGVKSFLEVDFDYGSGVNAVSLTSRIVRASDGRLLWSESYGSDSTTAALVRGKERNQTRDERRAELQRLIEGRPYYGQAAFLGTALIPWDHPVLGSLTGLTGGYRLYERFGPEKRSLFGLQLEGFMNLQAPLLGGFVSALFLQEISVKSLHLPEIRVGGGLGGFLVGTEGNSFYGEVVAEAMLKFRFGVSASVFYMYPAEYLGYDLGGFGVKARLTFNW